MCHLVDVVAGMSAADGSDVEMKFWVCLGKDNKIFNLQCHRLETDPDGRDGVALTLHAAGLSHLGTEVTDSVASTAAEVDSLAVAAEDEDLVGLERGEHSWSLFFMHRFFPLHWCFLEEVLLVVLVALFNPFVPTLTFLILFGEHRTCPFAVAVPRQGIVDAHLLCLDGNVLVGSDIGEHRVFLAHLADELADAFGSKSLAGVFVAVGDDGYQGFVVAMDLFLKPEKRIADGVVERCAVVGLVVTGIDVPDVVDGLVLEDKLEISATAVETYEGGSLLKVRVGELCYSDGVEGVVYAVKCFRVDAVHAAAGVEDDEVVDFHNVMFF